MPTIHRSLIVHADDLGISRSISDGIVSAHKNGVLTSTSVIATGDAFDYAMSLCQEMPTLDLGIHLTLVGERPALPPDQIPSLVTANGGFMNHAVAFVRRYVTGRIALDEVRRELSAQIEKVLSWGLPISHIDTHQHLHGLPALRRIALELAAKYRITAMRHPRERVRPYMLRDPRGLARTAQLLVLNRLCAMKPVSGLMHTDEFAGFYFGGNLNKRNLRTVLEHLPPVGTAELMCHPGFQEESGRYDHWNYNWREELDALTDPDLPAFLEQRGVELISYRDLSALRAPHSAPA